MADAQVALELLQGYVSGRVPAWGLPRAEVEALKRDLRPLGSARCIADIQERCAAAQRWFARLPTSAEQRTADRLLSACRNHCQGALNCLFDRQNEPEDPEEYGVAM